MKKRLTNKFTIRLDDDQLDAINAKAEEQNTEASKLIRDGLKKLFPPKPKTKTL